jgi:hypothetical protein
MTNSVTRKNLLVAQLALPGALAGNTPDLPALQLVLRLDWSNSRVGFEDIGLDISHELSSQNPLDTELTSAWSARWPRSS